MREFNATRAPKRLARGRIALSTMLSVGLIASMMTLPAVTAASAEEPTIEATGAVVPGEVADGVHGIVWIDLNGDGAQNDNIMGTTNTFGDPNVPGAGNESAGRAGVKIALLDGSGAVVAETTTDTTGAYNFGGIADGNYTVRAISPSLNYRWIMPSTSHSDFVGQSEAPPALHTALAPVTVTGGQSPSANGGLRPIPAISLDLFDIDPGTPGVQGVQTGTDPLPDPNGICPTEEPGNDCSRTDNRVTTNDSVTLNYSVNVTSMQEGAGSVIQPVGDVIIEVLLQSTDGAKPTFKVNGVNQIPTACREDRTVKSQIITEPNGDVRLICNVGEITQGGNSKYTLNLVPTAASPNGSTFTASAVAYSAINDAIPSEQFDLGPYEVSAAPRFNLAKRSDGAGDPAGGNQPIGGVVPLLNPVTGKVEDSIIIGYTAVIEAASTDARGQQSLTNNVSFTDKIDPRYAQYGAAPAPSSGDNRCREMTTYYAGKFGLPSFVNSTTVPGNNQMRSGTYSCNGYNQATGEFKVNVTGMDSSLQYIPEKSYDGKTNMQPHRLVSAGVVTVVYPISAIMKANIPGWKDGDPIVGDKYPVTNCYTNFDPSSPGGVSNFGTGFEPGWDGTTASGDNCQTHQIVIAASGSVVKSYGKIPASGDPLTEQSIGAPTEGLGAPNTIIPTSRSSWGSGDGMTTMDEEMYTYIGINNSAGTLALPDAQVCDVWDNSVQTLGAFSGGPSAGLLTSLSYSISGTGEQFDAFDPASRGITVEYGKLAAGGSWGNSLEKTLDANTGRYTGDWTGQLAAGQDCGTSAQNKGEMVFSTDPIADGWNLEDVNIIRVTGKDGKLDAGTSLIARAKLTTREFFYGGPNADERIIDGVIAANLVGFKWNNGYKSPIAYDPNTHLGTGMRGDRLTVQSVTLGVRKTADQVTSGDDLLTVTNVGDKFTWNLKPMLTSPLDDGIARNLTLTDTLPAGLLYEDSCTVTPDGANGPIISTNDKGLTTLTWSFGDRLATDTLPSIDVCTSASQLLPAGTTLINTVDIRADNVTYNKNQHQATKSVNTYATEGLRLQMGVDQRINFTDSLQKWSLTWANTAVGADIMPSQAIYVFSTAGDDGDDYASERRTYGSEYSGTLHLNGALPAPTASGGITGDVAGTWYYTSAAPKTVSQRANDASNDLTSGSTKWCTEADFGSAGCPASFDEVTAVRFIQDGNLTSQTQITVNVPLQAADNVAADLYIGSFGVWSETFATQPVVSNEPYVQVLGFSLGDLIWQDNDQDGVYDPAVDVGVPAGVKVQVYKVESDGSENMVAETTTNDQGRWVANKLDSGDYYVLVPADQFAEGGLLFGYGASRNGIQTDPNTDANEDVDNNNELLADGGLRSAGLMTLSATVDPPNVTGDEPLGDDVAKMVTNRLTGDDFTNMTLDLAVEALGGIKITKQLSGEGVQTFAGGNSLTFALACKVGDEEILVDDVELTVSDDATSVTSEVITGLPLGTECSITETDKGSADAAADAVTVTVVPSAATADLPANTVLASLTNYYSAGTLSLTKTVEGTPLALTQAEGKAFEVLVTCEVPVSLPGGDDALATVYSGTVKIKAGQTKQLADEEGGARRLPLGTHCYAEETDAGVAVSHTVDFDSYDNAAVITDGTPDQLQALAITVVNTFDESTIVVPPVEPKGPQDPTVPNGTNGGDAAGAGGLTMTGAEGPTLAVVAALMALMLGALFMRRRRSRDAVSGVTDHN